MTNGEGCYCCYQLWRFWRNPFYLLEEIIHRLYVL